MAQTFNDLVAECANYGHSKEHYDLMKECSEVTLMEQYLDDQAFMTECAEDETVHFEESYFAEGAAEEKINMLKEKLDEKRKDIFTKIREKIKKIIAAVKKFFGDIAARLTKTSGEARDLYKQLKDLELTNEKYKALADQLVDACTNAGITIERQQNFTIDLGVRGSLPVKYHKYFAVALADTDVNLALGKTDNVVDAEILAKIIKKFTGDNKKYDFERTVSAIKAAREDARKNGVIVHANDKQLEKIIKTLDEANTKLNETEAEVEKALGAGEAMNTAWTMINETVAATLKQYGGYTKYRTLALQKIKTFITEETNNKAASTK